jgi:predicted metal-dependent peptidase
METQAETTGYEHRGVRAVRRMVECAPSSGSLALWAGHRDLPDEPGAPDISTDGQTIVYRPSFEKLPLVEQVGLVAHEVLHVALRHPQRFLELQRALGEVDLKLFNTCADAIVNSTLSHATWLKLPPSAVYLEKLLESALQRKQPVEAALLEWDVERLYRAIDDRRPAGVQERKQQRGQKQQRPGSTGAEKKEGPKESKQLSAREDGPKSAQVRVMGAKAPIDLTPSSAAADRPEAEAELSREWSERLIRGHTGDGAHSMLRTLLGDVPKSRTPWEQVLRRVTNHALRPLPELSWSRPSRSYLANQGRCGDRRMPWEPGHSGSRAVPRLVVIVDVSGSVQKDLLERFAREVEAITRRLEVGLTMIAGDEKVQRVAHFEPGESDLGDVELKGGGGTDFTPLLEEADKHRPDLVIVLTDLDGPAHFQPRWPVLWAVPESHANAVQPFGRKLVLSFS